MCKSTLVHKLYTILWFRYTEQSLLQLYIVIYLHMQLATGENPNTQSYTKLFNFLIICDFRWKKTCMLWCCVCEYQCSSICTQSTWTIDIIKEKTCMHACYRTMQPACILMQMRSSGGCWEGCNGSTCWWPHKPCIV